MNIYPFMLPGSLLNPPGKFTSKRLEAPFHAEAREEGLDLFARTPTRGQAPAPAVIEHTDWSFGNSYSLKNGYISSWENNCFCLGVEGLFSSHCIYLSIYLYSCFRDTK